MIDFNDLDTDLSTEITRETIKKNAHVVNGGERVDSVACAKCGGSGRWRGRYASKPCFGCNGTGKVTARKAGAQKAQVTRAANLAAKKEEFISANGDLVAHLTEISSWNSFAISMLDSIETYGSLTENQIAATNRMFAKIEARREQKRAEAAAVRSANSGEVDVSAIETLFATALSNGLNKRAFRTDRLKITPAPSNGRNAGAIYVRDGEEYAGKIVSGRFMATNAAAPDVVELVRELAADPVGVARFYGRKTGVCCCCGRELTDPVSVDAGIGPICAEKWGLG